MCQSTTGRDPGEVFERRLVDRFAVGSAQGQARRGEQVLDRHRQIRLARITVDRLVAHREHGREGGEEFVLR